MEILIGMALLVIVILVAIQTWITYKNIKQTDKILTLIQVIDNRNLIKRLEDLTSLKSRHIDVTEKVVDNVKGNNRLIVENHEEVLKTCREIATSVSNLKTKLS